MSRTWLAAPALLIALTGCSGSDDPPAAGAPSTAPASPTTQPDEGVAVSLRSYPGFTSCQIDQGAFFIAQPMRVERPVTLTKVTLTGATNVVGGDTAVAPVPEGKHPDGFTLHGSTPPADLVADLGWKDREPLDGAQLSAGRYYVFVPLRTRGPAAHFDGVEVTWDEDGGSASSTAELVTDFKETC
ncbi:hypothetical protein ABLE68_02525 [Nocardioides sp. CN2-186]|uniref:hypothetical protein n=1 Tax=Nocardioides tweenelious TaxID=3156607 RepID=UPI0032B5A756